MVKIPNLFLYLILFSLKGQSIFPSGTWKGSMNFSPSWGSGYAVDAELKIAPLSGDSIFRWILTYYIRKKDSVKKDERNYELHIGKNDHVWIDEKNSIILHGKLLKNKMVFLFDVYDSRIVTQYSWDKDEFFMEHIAFSINKNVKTGGSIRTQDTIPLVCSYHPLNRQWTRMTKKSGQ